MKLFLFVELLVIYINTVFSEPQVDNVYEELEVNQDLFKMGYKTNTTSRRCKQIDNMTIMHDTEAGTYDYCVYEVNSTRGKYYHVVTYMHFDLPIIGQYLTFEVRGDSRVVYEGLVG